MEFSGKSLGPCRHEEIPQFTRGSHASGAFGLRAESSSVPHQAASCRKSLTSLSAPPNSKSGGCGSIAKTQICCWVLFPGIPGRRMSATTSTCRYTYICIHIHIYAYIQIPITQITCYEGQESREAVYEATLPISPQVCDDDGNSDRRCHSQFSHMV